MRFSRNGALVMGIYYQMHDADRDYLDREAALADYIVDSARECGVDTACDWCPYYHVTVGVCHYGSRWPECRTGRILKEVLYDQNRSHNAGL